MSQGLSSLVRTRRVGSGVQVWQACLEGLRCPAQGATTVNGNAARYVICVSYEIIFFAKL